MRNLALIGAAAICFFAGCAPWPTGSSKLDVELEDIEIVYGSAEANNPVRVHHPVEMEESFDGTAIGYPYVTISYEKREDKTSYLDAEQISELTKLLLEVWEEWGYPNLGAVQKHLSSFQVVSLHVPIDSEIPDPELAEMLSPNLYAENPTKALEVLGGKGAFCYPIKDPRFPDISKDANFFIVVKHWYLMRRQQIDTVLHEIIHAALMAGFGDGDGSHDRKDIWLRFGYYGGHNTMMDKILERFPLWKVYY